MQQTHVLLLSSIFPFSSSTDCQICFGPVKSEVWTFFLIPLDADYCDIALTAEAIEHILGFELGGSKKGKEALKATLLQN